MDHKSRRDKTFGHVTSRLGSKLPPQFTERTWESQPQAQALQQPTVSSRCQQQPPINHVPHIRNPRLRQYYLQGTAWDVNNTAVKQERASSDDQTRGQSGDTVFSISSQFHNGNGTSSAKEAGHYPPQASSPERELLLVVHKKKGISATQEASTTGQQQTNSTPDSHPQQELKAYPESEETLTAQPQSPSPEAEYDKLLDVEAVSMPDGQLCLLALPPECCPGEGPQAMPYLKLFCRYITDRKGVVSGILLVTPQKLFFDPCKSHPLVKENGCEEYLLSCSVDNLASVSFYSDITHVHFSTTQRRKGRTVFEKLKTTKNQRGHTKKTILASICAAPTDSLSLAHSAHVCNEDEEAQSRDMAEAERALDSGLLDVLSEPTTVLNSAATFCCGGQERTSQLKKESSTVKEYTTACRRPSARSPGKLMFVRLRAQLPAGNKKGLGGLQLGSNKTLPRRDTWLALSQESSDELNAYLTKRRPDLCILEGEEEGHRGEDEFVLIEDNEEEENFLQRRCSSGEDWEMVLMEDSREKPTLVIDREPEGLHSIVERSHILEVPYVKELCKELPPRTVGYNWQLEYSTSRHGASLKSLYRKVSATDSPALIVIKDDLDEVFGAFLSHPLRPSETFYGTGETFLFMLHPRFKCFRWTGDNSFFIKGDLDSFAIGGGSGHFGLWVDENLYLGRSSPCYTFNNCCLSETDDFRIMELEVWTFS